MRLSKGLESSGRLLKETVALKRKLFCSKNTAAFFTKEAREAWREDEAKSERGSGMGRSNQEKVFFIEFKINVFFV